MAYVVTLEGYVPPPRYEAPPNPWTEAELQESTESPFGTWITIDSYVFADPDVDPTNPKTRNFTTENATAESAWYRVIFQDADGDVSAPSSPRASGAVPPSQPLPDLTYATLEELRESPYGTGLEYESDKVLADALSQAERDIDWYAGFSGTPNETSGLRFDPVADYDVPIQKAISRSTCAQAAYRLYMGAAFFTDEMQYPEQSGRDQSVSRAQRMGPQARAEFPLGMRKLTGRFT